MTAMEHLKTTLFFRNIPCTSNCGLNTLLTDHAANTEKYSNCSSDVRTEALRSERRAKVLTFSASIKQSANKRFIT